MRRAARPAPTTKEKTAMLVRDVMTRPVVTVDPDTPIRAAAALLTGRGFTALPVVDGAGELVGIVTEADLLRGRLHHDARSPLLSEELTRVAPQRVAEVMTTEVVTALPWTDLADLVEQMRSLGIRSVPVVDGGVGLVGIVSRRDALATATRSDVAIEGDVRRRLEAYAGPGRWRVSVDGGRVTLGDAFGDPTEQHAASVVAASVRGVLDVRTVTD
jgi:CBS domain-containing protein